VGFNPSPSSWRQRHHYAHPGNGFWRLLADAGLTPVRLSPEEEMRLLEWRLGCTDVVDRPSASSAALTAEELRRGAARVRAQLRRWRPTMAAYTGKGVYRAVAGRLHAPVEYGRQATATVPGVTDFVLPCPSGRSGLPHAEKLRWYRDLAATLQEVAADRS
jgi:TDG/mug DNA glycosylase family protein